MKYIALLRARLATLNAQRDAKLGELDALADLLTTEARAAKPEEDAAAAALEADARAVQVTITETQASLDELLAVEAQRAALPKPVAPAVTGRAGGGEDPYDIDLRSAPRTPAVQRDLQDRAMKALEIEDDLDEAQKTHIDKMLRNKRVNRGGALTRHILATGRPEYREAFVELTLRSNPLLTSEQMEAVREIRGLQITADASGGFMMPFTIDPSIIVTNNGTINPIRQLATVITVATDNWQGITSAGVTASYDAEESEVSDDTPTLAQPSIAIHQGQAFVPFSMQAEDDLSSLSMEVSDAFADAKDRLESAAFTLGTGTGQPFGFVTEATTVASTTSDVFAVADVYKVRAAVAPRHRSQGVFMSALEIADLMRQFATGTGPQSSFWTDLNGDTPPNLIGKPWYENSEMDPTVTALAVNKILAFGDFKKYRIHDRIGMSVELVPHLVGANRRPTGQRGWYARFRHGARLVDVNAIKVLDA